MGAAAGWHIGVIMAGGRGVPHFADDHVDAKEGGDNANRAHQEGQADKGQRHITTKGGA